MSGVPNLSLYTPGAGAYPSSWANGLVQGGALLSTLRAFSGVANMSVFMVGTNSPVDGGQGFFVWNSTVVGTDDGGVTTIVPYGIDQGAWLRCDPSSASAAMEPVIQAATLELGRQQLLGDLSAGATHPPTTRGNYSAITTAYTGDLSQVGWPFPYTISGATTLGQPTTGYLYTPECSMYFDYLLNESGWNQSTSGNAGRTAATCHFTRVDQQGQGDCMGYVVIGTITSTMPGATTWLANPGISAYDSDFTAGASGVYLNPRETDLADGGFDCAAIGDVVNLNRTNATAALGEPWIGYRMQSIGSAAVDAAFSASGSMSIGLDLTPVSFNPTYNSAICLAPGQRIYFGSTNATAFGFPGATIPAGGYIQETGGNLVLTCGAGVVQIGPGGEVNIGQLLVQGACLPSVDNAYTLGGSTNRWSQVFAATGAINTSDQNEKQDIEELPEALLDAWDDMKPHAFRFRDAVSRKGAEARTHVGYIAQEFAAALSKQALVPSDWAAWCSDILETGVVRQGLRYDEIFVIAEAAHRRRLSSLEARLAALEDRIKR